MAIKAEIKGDNLIITLPLEKEPRPSTSGKTLVVATTHGNVQLGAEYKGKPVTIGVNAYIKKD
jgi:hypothetical protein